MAGRAGAKPFVKDKLQFYVDAGVKKSYPGSGSIMYNLVEPVARFNPFEIKNYGQIYSSWATKRAIWQQVSSSEKAAPVDAVNQQVFRLQKSSSLFGNSLNRQDSIQSSIDVSAAGFGAWSASLYVSGHPSNSLNARINMDLSDTQATNYTVGTGSDWVELSINDDDSDGGNIWFDISLSGDDGNYFYICDNQFISYIVNETKNTKIIDFPFPRLGHTSSSLIGSQPLLNYDCELVNGPVFNDLGLSSYFDMDGTSDIIRIDSRLNMSNNTTLHLVFASTVTGSNDRYAHLINGVGYSTTDGDLIISSSNEIYNRASVDERAINLDVYATISPFSSSFPLDNSFVDVHIVSTDEDWIWYLNGTQLQPTGSLVGFSRAISFRDMFNGSPPTKFALAQFYSKALTPREITQNFNAVKTRYGI